MSISRNNLHFYLSGGIDNTDPNASIGGPRSNHQVVGALNGLFDDVTGDEAAIGETEYRCIYFTNEDIDPDGLIAPVIWVAQQTPSSFTRVEIGVGSKNQVAPALEDVFAPLPGVEFGSPIMKSAAIHLPGQVYHTGDQVAVWVRRTVLPGAPSGEEEAVLRLAGDTY